MSRETLASTLCEELDIKDAGVGELYRAMDWLLARQEKIERRLARKHLKDGSLGGQLKKLCERFGLSKVAVVDDRGLLDERAHPRGRWNLRGWTGSRRCGRRRSRSWRRRRRSSSRWPRRSAASGGRCGAKRGSLCAPTALRSHKVGKRLVVRVTDDSSSHARDEAAIAREAALDGLYVLRTSVAKQDLSAGGRRARLQARAPDRTRVPQLQDRRPQGAARPQLPHTARRPGHPRPATASNPHVPPRPTSSRSPRPSRNAPLRLLGVKP